MDGNLNQTLNRIYNQRKGLSKVIITLPMPDQIDPAQLERLHQVVDLHFTGLVEFQHMSFYGSNIDKTRSNLRFSDEHLIHLNDVLLANFTRSRSMLISEFPVFFGNKVQSEWEIIYNFNWSWVGEENDSMLTMQAASEFNLAKSWPVYLYSDVQYDFWLSQHKLTKNVYRSGGMFDQDYMEIVSEDAIDQFTKKNPNIATKIQAQLKESSRVVFYPMRIEDPRYNFKYVVKYAKANKALLVITNPTSVAEETYSSMLRELNVLNLTSIVDKRGVYFMILDELRKDDVIIRPETDMHVSLIEQSILTKAEIMHQFSTKSISSYIA